MTDASLQPAPELGAFRNVPYMGVIFVVAEAVKRGFWNGHPDWSNLGQGQPEVGELPGAPPRIDTVSLAPGDHAYGPLEGTPELRESVAAHTNRLFRAGVDRSALEHRKLGRHGVPALEGLSEERIHGKLGLSLCFVHGGVGRGIDNEVGCMGAKRCLQRCSIAKIKVVNVCGDQLQALRRGVLKRSAQLAVGTCNKYSHGGYDTKQTDLRKATLLTTIGCDISASGAKLCRECTRRRIMDGEQS